MEDMPVIQSEAKDHFVIGWARTAYAWHPERSEGSFQALTCYSFASISPELM